MSENESELEILYWQALYVVFDGETKICFHVGENSAKINELLGRYSAEKFAFVTADNPHSNVLPESENKLRQSRLQEILEAENFAFLEGYSTNEDESRKREQSFFIFDISEEKALKLARKFAQNAIVFGAKKNNCRLVRC